MDDMTMKAIQQNKLEITNIKTKNGKNIRVIYNELNDSVRLILDHSILKDCKQVDFVPMLEVEGFYQD